MFSLSSLWVLKWANLPISFVGRTGPCKTSVQFNLTFMNLLHYKLARWTERRLVGPWFGLTHYYILLKLGALLLSKIQCVLFFCPYLFFPPLVSNHTSAIQWVIYNNIICHVSGQMSWLRMTYPTSNCCVVRPHKSN